MEPRRGDRPRDGRRNDRSAPPPSPSRGRSRSPRDKVPTSADEPPVPSYEGAPSQHEWSDSTEVCPSDAICIASCGGGPALNPDLADAPILVTSGKDQPQSPLHRSESGAPVDPSETMDGDAGDPFALVTYKKNRPQGIPVLFKPVLPDESFWRVNPNLVAQAIRSAAQEPILNHRVNSDGSMCIFIQTEGAVSNLLGLQEVAGIAVNVTIPSSYVKNMGKIFDVPLEYSNADLASYLEDDGVISARRQMRHVSHEDGSDQYIPLRSVILTFKSNKQLPREIHLGFSSHKVHEYVEGPAQCYRCQRFGHLARGCRWPIRCKICSGPHSLNECTARRQPKCANCAGSHIASHSLCPHKRSAIRRFQARTLNTPQRPSSRGFRPGSNTPATRGTSPVSHPSRSADRQRRPSKPESEIWPSLPSKPVSPAHNVRRKLNASPPAVSHQAIHVVPPHNVTYAGALRRSERPPGPRLPAPRQQKSPTISRSCDDSTITRLVLAALKAIVARYPDAARLPEVNSLLAMDSFFSGHGASV